MKIAYRHLLKNIKEKPQIEDLSIKLFQLGHEHEIENEIFNFEFTPNRGDCLSLRGLLRDLGIFYDVTIVNDIYNEKIESFKIDFVNKMQDFCPKISFLKVEIESVPDHYTHEVEEYFNDLDVKKNNFFTDISNYISYETGQPTHCYEESKLGDKIILDRLQANQDFNTLLNKKICLQKDDLVFLNNKKEVINLAGIMGGNETSCTDNTTSVIIECAYFVPDIIIGKTTKYVINSDAAYKFERNTDPEIHDYALRRLLRIIDNHTNILNVQICTHNINLKNKKVIKYESDKINQIIGTNIGEEISQNYLKKLGFSFNDKFINVPSHRHDIYSLNDIAEEVGRAIGYDNIKPVPIKIEPKDVAKINNKEEKKARKLLIDNGFYEVINDPFVLNKDDTCFEVDNPLDSNRKYLRTNLKDSLLKNLLYNERRQKDSVKLFEITDIYSSEFGCKRILGIIASGRVDKNYQDFNKKINENYLKGILDTKISSKGNLSYQNLSRENLNSKSKEAIIFCEIEIDSSFKVNYSNIKNNNVSYNYIPISEFPVSSRDLSFSIKDFKNSKVLQEYILNFNDTLLKEVFIFDYFYNDKTNEIKIGFRFIFQDTNTTITETKVNNIMDVIIENSIKLNGVNIPGLN